MNAAPALLSTISLLCGVASAQNCCPAAWTAMPSLPEGRSDAGAEVDANGCLLFAGGNANPAPPYATADCFAFDEASQQWSVIAPMIEPRSNFGIARDWRGRVYVCGGFTNDPVTPPMTAACERYDAAASNPQWTSLPAMPEPLGYTRAVASPDGRSVFVLSGQTTANLPSGSVYRFDVDTETWHVEPPMLYPHALAGVAITPSGEIVATGQDPNSPTAVRLQRRDPWTGSWSDAGLVPFQGNQIGACIADQFGDVWIFGGYSNGTTLAQVWRYSTRDGTWWQCNDLPDATNNMAVVISPSYRCYLIGGDPGTGSIRLDTVIAAQLGNSAGAAIYPFGAGCAGPSGTVPTLRSSALPIVGTTLPLAAGNLGGAGLVLGLIEFGPRDGASLPLGGLGQPGCLLHVEIDVFTLLAPAHSWLITLPPTLAGFEFSAQILALDLLAAPIRLFGSNGAHALVGY